MRVGQVVVVAELSDHSEGPLLANPAQPRTWNLAIGGERDRRLLKGARTHHQGVKLSLLCPGWLHLATHRRGRAPLGGLTGRHGITGTRPWAKKQ